MKIRDWGQVMVLVSLLASTVVAQNSSVIGSPHDLSPGRGGDACGFCHTPHGSSVETPLWSQALSTTVYEIYQSSSLEASVGQPTGASKKCLSCHDGTVALPIAGMSSGQGAYIAPGQANLGTDLSDDHPVSFVYSDSLSAKDPQLRPASILPESLQLDRDSELQCTTCHDAHNNQYGAFLALPNRRSALCTSCHSLDGWGGSSHEHATASVSGSHNAYLREGPFQTVADYGCLSCHRPHAAGGHERLLQFRQSEDNCLSCHDGSVAQTNIKSQLTLLSRHDVAAYRDVHDLRESPMAAARHVECEDCHNPHAVQSYTAQAPLVPGSMQKVSGVTSAGGLTPQARYEYEICFKCHADNPDRPESTITRVVSQTNTRLEFDPSGPAYHPVVSSGVNKHVPSLQSPFTVASVIYCTDCHSSSDAATKGPHGSMYAPILRLNYETTDYTAESNFAYALCYDCHSRNSILSNESFPEHRRHLDDRIPCSACHDAHGISSAQGSTRNHSHLINFDTSIVAKDPDTDRLEFEDLGVYQGRCYLMCHGEKHSAHEY